MRYVFSLLTACCALALLSACESEKQPLKGTRLPVIDFDKHTKVDPEVFDLAVTLPASLTNGDWSQAGGNAAHATGALSLGPNPQILRTSSIGRGTTSEVRFVASPVVARGMAFALDTELNVVATQVETGETLWSQDVARPDKKDPSLGGGLAIEGEILVVSSPLAEVMGLNTQTGEIVWRHPTTAPLRAAPTIEDGRVYVVTLMNQMNVYDLASGKLLWSHAGIIEQAGLLGMAAPAVSSGVVVAAYSSGEVVALKAENGHELWSETLSAVNRPDSLANISHIRALPVIQGGRVYVLSHNQRLAALDLRNGSKIWERRMGGLHHPAVAGDFLFVITNEHELICLVAETGQVVWVTPLPKDENNPKRALWAGPVVAGDKIYLVSRDGTLLAVDPQKGEIASRIALSRGSSVQPIVADGKMFIFNDSGQLVVMK